MTKIARKENYYEVTETGVAGLHTGIERWKEERELLESRQRIAELEAENAELLKALQWAIDEGGWRLFYESAVPIPEKAIEIGGDTAKLVKTNEQTD